MMTGILESRFRLSHYGTTPGREVIGGLITYLTLAYIIVVNPNMLGLTGMPVGAVMIATCLSAAIGTIVMALYANLPFAQAPGMGLNAFFTFTVVFGLGFSWQQALAMVFVCGIVNIIIVFTRLRQKLVNAIPRQIQLAIGAGIGGFIAYIGIKNAGLIKFTLDPGTYVQLGDGDPLTTTIVSNASAVPGIVAFNNAALVLGLLGIVIMAVLMVKKVPGAMLVGIGIATVLGVPFGLVNADFGGYLATLGDAFGDFGSVVGQALAAIPSLFSGPAKLPLVIATIFAMSLTDTMDTIGTLLSAGGKLFSMEEIAGRSGDNRFARALRADGLATAPGALLGTSNTTTYIESGAGIMAGARTGLASMVTAGLMLLSILLLPLTLAVPAYATAPALIIVGFMMFAALKEVRMDILAILFPAMATIVFMIATYSITEGIAIGLVLHCAIRVFQTREERLETSDEEDEHRTGFNPFLVAMTGLFVLHWVISALI
ncbi:MAG: NCS2 family permease [Candidatus Nomurabacteria bacterium]|jgi:AGZA family xanthine/uracil permease-like MFS transporter|nr:NCS2 family permease [Candidatus Nomurabacteria bacterium]